MDAKKLNDEQLYSLVIKDDLDADIKRIVLTEFKNRKFTIEKIDNLDINLRKEKNQNEGLTWKEKIIIILFPAGIPIHGFLATRHIKKANTKKWSEHWKFLGFGYLFYLMVLFIVVWLMR